MDVLLLAVALAFTASAEEPAGPAEEAQEMSQSLAEILEHLKSIPTPDEQQQATLESMEQPPPDLPEGEPVLIVAGDPGLDTSPPPDTEPK